MGQLPYTGSLNVPALKVNEQKPIDVRTVVNSVEDLTNATISNLYTGIVVNIKGTSDLYVLVSSPRLATQAASWKKVGGDADVDLTGYVKIEDLPEFLTDSDLTDPELQVDNHVLKFKK